MQFEAVVETETVTNESEEVPAPKKAGRLVRALKTLGNVLAQVAVIIVLIALALAVFAGAYLLVGWLLALLIGFITGGFLAISALQGAAVLLTINLAFGGLRIAVR